MEIDEDTYKEIAAAQPAPAPAPKQPPTWADLARIWRSMEDAMDALKAECEAKVKEIKAKQDKYTEVMLGQMRAMKADNLDTAEGVIRVKEQTHVNAADWEAIRRYIVEHNKWEYVQKRLTSSEILKDAKANAVKGENGREVLALPPGMSIYTDYKLTVAKPAGRKALPKDDEGAN
jgi:hypothetical protein